MTKLMNPDFIPANREKEVPLFVNDENEIVLEKPEIKVLSVEVNPKYEEGKKKKGSSYLGKVVFPAGIFKLEVTVLKHEEKNFLYAILPGENRDGFKSVKFNNEQKGGVFESSSMEDLKTAAIQIVCLKMQRQLPFIDNHARRGCHNCLHKRSIEFDAERLTVCGLDGSIVSENWEKMKKYLEEMDRGLVAKKEKSTKTYEHPDLNPNLRTSVGRYKYTENLKNDYLADVPNCPYHGYSFPVDNGWVIQASRRLPMKGTKIIGSEFVVDAEGFIEDGLLQLMIEEYLNKLELSYKQLRRLPGVIEQEMTEEDYKAGKTIEGLVHATLSRLNAMYKNPLTNKEIEVLVQAALLKDEE